MSDTVDLASLTDDELHATFDELCAKVSDTEAEDRRDWHNALMAVTAELGRRTDAWLAERARPTTTNGAT